MTDNRRRPRNRRHNKVMEEQAVAIARQAIAELDDGPVGKHVGVNMVGRGVAVHRFRADLPGYRGWEWNVVVACAPGTSHVTVSEVALVPGKKALQAPEWVPYEDRLRPGDLGPRDLMPAAADDDRLTGGEPQERELTDLAIEQTKQRWLDGETGPQSKFAVEALEHCATCAFMIALSGELGKKWGVCVNEWAFDGSVVHRKHGCGAHSATTAPEHS